MFIFKTQLKFFRIPNIYWLVCVKVNGGKLFQGDVKRPKTKKVKIKKKIKKNLSYFLKPNKTKPPKIIN